MFQQFFSSRKTFLLILAGVIVLAFLALTWRIVSLQKAASEVDFAPVLKIGYCGAEPEELCVLSFGRDVDENMVVTVFVPDRKFAAFYLKIGRAVGESVYECEKDKEVRTYVFCYGDMVNLQERMEVSLLSLEDDHVLAVGQFTLKALLISEPSFAKESDGTSTPELIVDEAPTSTEVFDTPTEPETPIETDTPTPEASYPNSSYP